MTRPLSTDKLGWLVQCGSRIQEIEPRLDTADCKELANTLWQLDDYQGMSPQAAAERFMADNPCADSELASPWWVVDR